MLRHVFLVLLSVFIINGNAEEISVMDQASMEQIVKEMADEAEGGNGVVQFKIRNLPMYLISDVKNDRMRIIAPIAEYSKITKEQIDKIMESNFHSSLDARYAVSENIVYSAYIHPLSKLDDEQIRGAVVQVFNLAATFGTDYTSGVLTFGGNSNRDDLLSI